MRGQLIMNEKERIRKGILSNWEGNYIQLKEAAQQMRVSYRQAKRIKKRYEEEGDKGLIHRNRGNPKVGHGYNPKWKEAVLKRYQKRYEGFGPTLAKEKLEEEGYPLSRETLRKWLIEQGLWERKRKRQKHRNNRERRACFGELVQMDGSIHEWFGAGKGKTCLLNMVDDATGITLSLMAKGETTEVVMKVLGQWIERYGIPQAIYVDGKTVYLAPKELSIFEQACSRIGIEIIHAYSPQAKGRVERNHGVYQDRYVKELKLRGIETIEGANEVLMGGFTDQLNQKFAKEPLSPQDAHAPLCGIDLNQVLVWEYSRQIQNDWTIDFQGKRYQILDPKNQLRAKQYVSIKIHLDGSMAIETEERMFDYQAIEKPSYRYLVKEKKVYSTARRRWAGYRGKQASPWNQYNPGWLHRSSRSKELRPLC